MGNEIRPYSSKDRPAVRVIFGSDEFARPKLLQKYPKFSEYLADEMSYYTDFEPESVFVADMDGQVVGALLGAVDTGRFEKAYHQHIRPLLWRRTLMGNYGWPGWLPAIWKTEWAERKVKAPAVNRQFYPAHLHIGVLLAFRRRGFGTELMERFANYLHSRGICGYHLYASSFHPLGMAFYQKIGLKLWGKFEWRLHTGFEWINVIESIFVKHL